MNLLELFVIAFGLSMDAFAVAVCKGMAAGPERSRPFLTGFYFGSFQALMPLIGFLCGIRFSEMINSVDHWIAFFLLLLIGGRMLADARQTDEPLDGSFAPSAMFPLALATSIDALAIGTGLAFLNVPILPAILLIGGITFSLSALGIRLGCLLGSQLRSRSEIIGGVILMLMGTKILLEHLNFLS